MSEGSSCQEQYLVKNYEMNKVTKRYNQVICCTLCDHKFTKLCNARDHLRTHL